MDLIKKLNKQVIEEREEMNNPFKILDITNIRGVNDILENTEGKCGSKPKAENEESGFSKQQMADMKKLANQAVRAAKLHPDINIVKVLGDDLEMLEYNPDEVETMIPEIKKMMKGMK
jgi:DNA helicase IV